MKKRKYFRIEGNVCAPDGSDLVTVGVVRKIEESANIGVEAAKQILSDPRAQKIIETVRNGKP